MLGFAGRRLPYLVPVLIAVTLLTFLIAALLPGDLAVALLADQATPEKVAALRHEMGLDAPLVLGADARVALRHDRDPAGRLYRDGQSKGSQALAHPSGARAETVLADIGDGDRHQYRAVDWRRRAGRDDLRVARNWPAADRRDLHPRLRDPAGCRAVRRDGVRADQFCRRHALRRARSENPPWPRLTSKSNRLRQHRRTAVAWC